MRNISSFYVDGQWVAPSNGGSNILQLTSPITEQVNGHLVLGSDADIEHAVTSAKSALLSYSQTSQHDRAALLKRIHKEYLNRHEDLSEAIADEIGCPPWLAKDGQFRMAEKHLQAAIEILNRFEFESVQGRTLVRKQPVGVCGLITPWNWPLLQIMIKLAPALATGCTVVWKPSEYASFSAHIMAEILDAADVPPGVFNMVHGDGATVGHALSTHPDVSMISVTGSTGAGIEIARQAAATVKRVHQELGGKCPAVLLEDADFKKSIASSVQYVMLNSGQNCTSPTRLVVPRARISEAAAIAREVAESMKVGPPETGAIIGPVANKQQWARIQSLIQQGIEEGAELVLGGAGLPDGIERGYFVKPTIFTNVRNDMVVAQEEIFGPVLAIIPYDSIEEAIHIANDNPYGLAAYVHSASHMQAKEVAGNIVAGQVFINGDMDLIDVYMPFGGRKMSGNGREFGVAGFEAFTEEVTYPGYIEDT